MAELNSKQQRFCEEYLIDLNGKQAAIRAGYSPRTAEVQASRLLSNVKVQVHIQEKQRELQKKIDVTQEMVIDQYRKIAFADIRRYYNEDGSLKKITDLDDDSAAALAGVETDELFAGFGEDRIQIGVTRKIKRWEPTKALDSLARHLGMFAKDNEQSRSITPIVNNVGNMETTELKKLQELLSKANGH